MSESVAWTSDQKGLASPAKWAGLAVLVFAGLLFLCSCARETAPGYVGISFSLADGMFVVEKVFSGSPAAVAGVSSGDTIVRVDGVSCTGESTPEVADRIMGGIGSSVQLDLRRVDGSPYHVRLKRVPSSEIGNGFAKPEDALSARQRALARQAFDYGRWAVLATLGNPAISDAEPFEEWLTRICEGSNPKQLFVNPSEAGIVASWIQDSVGVLWYGCAVSRQHGKWGLAGTPGAGPMGTLMREVDGRQISADLAKGYAGFPPELRPDGGSAEYAACISQLLTVQRGLSDVLYMKESEPPREWLLRIVARGGTLTSWLEANEKRAVPDAFKQLHSELCAMSHAVAESLLAFAFQVEALVDAMMEHDDLESAAGDPDVVGLLSKCYQTRDYCELALQQLAEDLSQVEDAVQKVG